MEAAHELGKLCAGRHLVVNLIPYNQTDVKDRLRCPSKERLEEFRSIVASYGSFCSLRRTMGADIAGACGQLVVEEEKKQLVVADIEDGPFGKEGPRERRPAPRVAKRSSREKETRAEEGLGTAPVNPWVRRLAGATAVAASLSLVSVVLLLHRRKR